MVSLRRFQLLAALPVVGALFGITGCGGDTGATKPSDPTEEAAAEAAASLTQPQDKAAPTDCAEGARGHRPPPGGGGPLHLLMAALHELDLTDAQKSTIEGLLARNAPGARERGPQDRVALTALTESVRAGKIDAATVLTRIGASDRGPDARGADAASALQVLHTTLTKEQRRTLVDAMTARMAERGPRPDKGERGPEGARGPGREHGPGGDRFGKGGPLGHMLDGLSLTEAQRTSIDAALAAQRPAAVDHEAMKKGFEAMKTEMSARIESFAADSFDAKAFVAPPAGAPQGGPMHPLARMVNELAVVVPLLDSTQREALAAQLEKGPPMGRPGDRDRGPGPR